VDDLYGLVPYLAAIIAFAGSAYLFTRGPKEGCFDWVSPTIQTAMTLSTLGLYVGLMKVNTSPAVWVISLGAGIALGAYGSWSTTLELQADGSLRTKRTMWYLAVLAASMGVSQVFIRHTSIHQGMFHGGLAALYFGTGTAVASNLTLMLRAASLKGMTLNDVFAPVRSFNWRQGTEGSPWEQVKERWAERSAASSPAATGGMPRVTPAAQPGPMPSPTATMTESRCPKCGAVAPAGGRFCKDCGAVLSEGN
jgi:hypothetical protein